MAFKSLQGQLLLDNGRLQGSFFHHTALLICQHNPDGAFGLILNRPAGPKVGDVLDADLPESLRANDSGRSASSTSPTLGPAGRLRISPNAPSGLCWQMSSAV